MAGDPAVGVDDDLAPGQPRVGCRPAQHEGSARVDHDLGRGVDDVTLKHRVDDQFAHTFVDLFLSRTRRVMRRDDHRLDSLRLAELVFDRDLRLAVGPEKRKRPVLAGFRELFGKTIGEGDREGHQFRCLPAGEADHHPLVPRALQLKRVLVLEALALFERVVHTGRDVGRLLFQIHLDQRVVGVETDLLVVVADRADGVADRALDVKVGVGRHLADDPGLARVDHGHEHSEHFVIHLIQHQGLIAVQVTAFDGELNPHLRLRYFCFCI